MCFEVQKEKSSKFTKQCREKKLSVLPLITVKTPNITLAFLATINHWNIQEFNLKSKPEITWIEWAVDRTFLPDRLLFPLRLKQIKFTNIYDLAINIVQQLPEICKASQVFHCYIISERLANLYLLVEHHHLQKPLHSPPTARNIAFRHMLLIKHK